MLRERERERVWSKNFQNFKEKGFLAVVLTHFRAALVERCELLRGSRPGGLHRERLSSPTMASLGSTRAVLCG